MNKKVVFLIGVPLLALALYALSIHFYSPLGDGPHHKDHQQEQGPYEALSPTPSAIETPSESFTPEGIQNTKIKILGKLPSSGLKGLRYLNTPSKSWQQIYEKELLRFQEEGSQVKIIKEERFLEILPKNQARYLEKIIVVITHENGKEDSFSALIDSQSGSVVKTFNQVKRDDIPLSPMRAKGMTPSGVIEKKE